MKKEINDSVNHLIRDYMDAMGTSRTTLVALNSYIDSIGRVSQAAYP